MISLYKDPKGEKIFSKYGCDGMNTMNSVGGGPGNGTGDSINAMRSKVIKLEAELEIARVSGGVLCGFMFVCVHVYMCVYIPLSLFPYCSCVSVCFPPPPHLISLSYSCLF